MTGRVAALVFGLSVLGTTLPVFGQAGRQPAQVTTTERVGFAPGGIIRIDHSYGELNVEGWGQPEVEVTVIKSMPYDYKPKRRGTAAESLGGVRIVTQRKSDTELVISTSKSTGGVRVEYEIHVPRNSGLAIHHGTGSVSVHGVAGDIEAIAGRGDIMLWLPPGSYSIDAKTKLGNVSSELEGAAVSQYLVGQRFTRVSPLTPSHRLYLRMGFGGITIRGILPESEAPAVASAR